MKIPLKNYRVTSLKRQCINEEEKTSFQKINEIISL